MSPKQIRTPTPPRFGTHNFSSLSPTKLYSKNNAVPSLKRKTPSPNKKKSKVRHLNLEIDILCARNVLTFNCINCFLIYYHQKRKIENVEDKSHHVIEVICDHDKTHEFKRNDNKQYYSKAYYDKNPYAPRHCQTCGDTKLFGIDIKVNDANPVHYCKNCNFAYCNACFVLLKTNKTDRKKTKNKPIM